MPNTKKPIKSDASALEKIGPNTKTTLKNHKAVIRMNADPVNRQMKYSKSKRMLWFKSGYDLLEYSIVVKPYIYKKYRMKSQFELDALLYLFPKQFFNQADFNLLGLKQYNISIKTMIESNYLEEAISRTKTAGSIYTLTDKSIKLVREYYEYLSGEKVLNAKSYTNPFRGAESAKVDKLRERVMLKLKHQSENYPDQFRKGLYKKI